MKVPRNKSGQFVKGVGGNPLGVAKVVPTVKELATANSEMAFRQIVSLAKNKKTPANVRLQAAKEILDRAWGKVAPEEGKTGGGDIVINLVNEIMRDPGDGKSKLDATIVEGEATEVSPEGDNVQGGETEPLPDTEAGLETAAPRPPPWGDLGNA